MKTIQITIDESLLGKIDNNCGKRDRSSFFRKAALILLKQLHTKKLEEQHRAGYARKPVQKGEFDIWQDEQVWPE
jgi:metal-responsive CopG/Arc/MetJ family transcriptional regulator